MNRNQYTKYTIRSIPPKLDVILRRRAQKSGKSLNEILIETLSTGAGVSPDAKFNDLDWFNLNRFLALPRVELLHTDEITAKLFGEIVMRLKQRGQPIQQDDMWIAALCKQYGYTLATADKDFDAITGLEIINF